MATQRNAAAGFAGAYRDCASFANPLGNGYRWYLPWLMRFDAPDSWSPFGGGGPNAYAYCEADPINRSDPSGHAWTGLESLTSAMAERATREAMQEASSSLAAEASERAAREPLNSAPSTSGGAPGAIRGSILGRKRARFNVEPLVIPDRSRTGVPELGEVNESMRRYRGAATRIERRATALEAQWHALVRDARRERARLGVANPIAAQHGRQTVRRLVEETNSLLGDLHALQTHLGGNTAEFETQQREIRDLQGRIAPIAGRVRDLQDTLRLEVNQSSQSVFRFDVNQNEN